MRLYRSCLPGLLLFFACQHLVAQNCVPTGNNNTVINFSCGVNCGPVNLQIPHLKSSSDYILTPIDYTPYPFLSPSGNELPVLYADDEYSAAIPLNFNFCFYDSIFTKVVVGSNGLVTFDTANASCDNAWTISPPIFFAGGTICNAGSTYYPKSSIMAAYSDLDPRSVASPPDKRIEWRIEGFPGCRKFIVSFYRIGVFGSTCGLNTPNTFQIVFYEATGLIDVFFEQKTCFSSTNTGKGIFGIQNWERDKAVAGANRNATQWNAQNEGWRFVPSGGASRFVSAELLKMDGTFVALADTVTTTEGLLDISFQNICPTGSSEQFVVRTTYGGCGGAFSIETFDTITVNKATGLNATTTTTNLNCSNTLGGSISVNVANGAGVPPYTYTLNGGPAQAGNVFTGLTAGTYTVTATDMNGCSYSESVTVTTTGNLSVNATAFPTSCLGVPNGSIIVNSTSGIPPLTYSINGGPAQSSNVFPNLPTGNYNVTVTDSRGCSGTQTVSVLAGVGLSGSVSSTGTSCSGANNGTITVTLANGTPPFQYSIVGNPPQSSNIFTGLAPGVYSVSVSDANNCVITFNTVVVGAGVSLTGSTINTNISCNGAANGSFVVNITNGSPPYQYSIDGINFQSSNSFTGLGPGSYTVTIRDNNNCSGTIPVTITQPPALSLTPSSQAALCNSQSNGSIIISAAGGTSPYQYSIDGVNYQASNSFNVASGVYTVYVRDNNGCIATQPVTITQPPVLTVNTNATNASCNGGADGVITVNAAGGNGGYQYSINGTTFQVSNIFNVIPGTYTVTVKDVNNCTATRTVTVGLTDNLTIARLPDTTICEGTSVQLNVITNAIQYAWSPATGLNNPSVVNPVASPTTTTEYILTATLGNCVSKDSIIVNVNPAPIADAGIDGDICYGLSYQLQGSGGVDYLWTPPTSLNDRTLRDPVSTPAQTITYSLDVVDANGCSSLVSDQVIVKVTPPIIVNTFPSDTIVYAGDQFKIQASSAGTDYVWSPPIGLNNPSIPDPVLTVSTDITFTVIATTTAGCKGEGIVNIKVYNGPDIYMPTGFTPNNDGRNDVFRPIPVGIKEIKYFRVYNRWGQLIFSTTRLHDGWDGRIRGSLQPTGTYVWMVQGVTKDEKVITKRGTVTLIR